MLSNFTCRLCSSKTCQLRFKVKDINRKTDELVFEYYQCSACNSVQLSNIPDNIAPYYGNNYYALPDSAEALLGTTKHDKYKLEIVKRYIGEGKLLEIGPGAGGFAYLAKLGGLEVDVIELDDHCKAFIKNKLGIKVLDEVETLNGNNLGMYDIVVMWHVLEHIADIKSLLVKLAEHIKPGGIFIAALPNPESIQFRLFGKYWVHLDAPRHINLITADTLSTVLSENSFTTIWKSFGDAGTQYWNRFGWIYSSNNIPCAKIFRPITFLLGYGLATISYFLAGKDISRSGFTLVAKRDKL